MTTYRFFFIDTHEHIGRSERVECPSDERAVDIAAEETGDYRAIQIWNGDRPIAMVGNPRNRGKD
jgi:hypothetical protein